MMSDNDDGGDWVPDEPTGIARFQMRIDDGDGTESGSSGSFSMEGDAVDPFEDFDDGDGDDNG